jgi:hypothetical protein
VRTDLGAVFAVEMFAPLFFEPAFDAQIRLLPGFKARDGSTTRWDRQNVHIFAGTYGAYLLEKVAKVFPDLRREIKV